MDLATTQRNMQAQPIDSGLFYSRHEKEQKTL